MKKFFATILIGVVFLMVPVLAIGATLTGSIQGFTCVTEGRICPVGMEDPVIAAENVFVLLVDAAKGDYYFIPNLDKSILARHINQVATITGTVDEKLKSIKATKLTIAGKDVWTIEMEEEYYKQSRNYARFTLTI